MLNQLRVLFKISHFYYREPMFFEPMIKILGNSRLKILGSKIHRLSHSTTNPPFPPLPSNFFRASFNVTYLQLYPYISALMSFQHRLIINTHHASAYDLILNVLDRYGSSSPLQLFPCLI